MGLMRVLGNLLLLDNERQLIPGLVVTVVVLGAFGHNYPQP
jgi:hypothetical protein